MSVELLAARARDFRDQAAVQHRPDDGTVTGPALAALLARYPDCYLCGRAVEEAAAFDDVRELKGDRARGPNTLTLGNLLPACRECNRGKAGRSSRALESRLRAFRSARAAREASAAAGTQNRART